MESVVLSLVIPAECNESRDRGAPVGVDGTPDRSGSPIPDQPVAVRDDEGEGGVEW